MITSRQVDMRMVYDQSWMTQIPPVASSGGVIESFPIHKIREVIWDDLSLRRYPSSVMREGSDDQSSSYIPR